jgi:uncharacterized Zn-finger protein
MNDSTNSGPNCETSHQVTADDLPLHCPTSGTMWNSHPRVYIPLDDAGHGKCPYCGTEYYLNDKKS